MSFVVAVSLKPSLCFQCPDTTAVLCILKRFALLRKCIGTSLRRSWRTCRCTRSSGTPARWPRSTPRKCTPRCFGSAKLTESPCLNASLLRFKPRRLPQGTIPMFQGSLLLCHTLARRDPLLPTYLEEMLLRIQLLLLCGLGTLLRRTRSLLKSPLLLLCREILRLWIPFTVLCRCRKEDARCLAIRWLYGPQL